MKKLISIILFIMMSVLLVNIVSAQLTLSPNPISVSAYAGESYPINITITTDGWFFVWLNTSNNNISIYPNEFVVNHNLNIIVNLTFSNDIASGIYNIDLTATTEQYQNVIVNSNNNGGGGNGNSRTVYKTILVPDNKTITIPENKTSEIILPPLNCITQNCTDNMEESAKEIPKKEANFIVRFFRWLFNLITGFFR